MEAYINQPKKIPFILRLAIRFAERKTGKPLAAARLLSWYPKAAIGSGLLESLVTHQDRTISERLLKLIRMQVSFCASCPFCIDMNSAEYKNLKINSGELQALQGIRSIDEISSFSEKEKVALKYALALSRTPVSIPEELLKNFLEEFDEREIVIIVSTIAQVNYWTRLIQGFGIPPAGFSDSCPELNLARYATLKRPSFQSEVIHP